MYGCEIWIYKHLGITRVPVKVSTPSMVYSKLGRFSNNIPIKGQRIIAFGRSL